MKRTFSVVFLAVLFFLPQKLAAEPWRVVHSMEGQQLNSVSIPDPIAVYVVGGGAITGGDGIILKSEDGGITWVEKYRNAGVDIYGIDCQGALVCYAAGSNSTILRKPEEGETWSASDLSTLRATTFNDIKIVSISPRVVVAVGNNGTIMRLADGAWRVRTSPLPSANLTSVSFSGAVGYIGSDSGQILKSINGGASWGLIVTPADLGAVEDVYTLDADKLRAAGFRFGKSDTGGEDFSTALISPGNLSTVAFIDELNGWAAIGYFGGEIHRTTDGSASWIQDEDTSIVNADGSPFTTGTFKRKIRFSDEYLGFVVGDGFIARRYIPPPEMSLRRTDEGLRVSMAYPDLAPSDGWSMTCLENSFHFIGQVRNSGSGRISTDMLPFQVRLESLDTDNNVIGSVTYDITEPVPAAGMTAPLPVPSGAESYRLFNPANLARLKFRMTVDVNGNVTESSEDNNAREQETTCAISESRSAPAGGTPGPNPLPRGKDGKKKDDQKKKFVKPKK